MILGRCRSAPGYVEANYGLHDSSYTLATGGGKQIICGRYPNVNDLKTFCFPGGRWVFFDLTKERLNDYRNEFHHFNSAWRFFRFPIEDDYPPADLQRYLLCVDLLESFRRAGFNVYLHCRGGIGRTGTVALGWLGRHVDLLALPNAECRDVKLAGKASRFVKPVGYSQCHTVLNYLRECDIERGWRMAPEVRQDAWLRDHWALIACGASSERMASLVRFLAPPRG